MTKKRRPLLDKLRYFTKRERYSEDWSEVSPYDRSWEDMYRSQWSMTRWSGPRMV